MKIGRVKIKKITFLFGVYLLLTGCSGAIQQSNNEIISENIAPNLGEEDVIALPDGSQAYPDGEMKLAEGSYASGLTDSFGNPLIQNGDSLPVKDNRLTGTITLQQNIPEEQIEYSLIVLIDYVQQNFSVNGQQYQSFIFALLEEDMIAIDFDLEIPENASIFTYLIVNRPNLKELTFSPEGREDFLETELLFAKSCYLKDYEYNADDYAFSDGIPVSGTIIADIPILTKDINQVRVMPSCISGDKDVKLLFSNSTAEDKTYAMIAFKDWEQTPINGDKYQLIKLEANKTYCYNIDIPDVEVSAPYQIFALPNPFNPIFHETARSTLRTIIHNF